MTDEMPPERSRHAWRAALAIVPVAFVLCAAVNALVLEDFPNSADEYVYLWQAKTFALGQLTAEIPQPRDAFAFFHLGDLGGHRFGRFPPGWPLLLAPGAWLEVSGLVNPLLAALALAGLFRLGCAWVGERAAWLGTLLTGLSPFFLLNAGSYHSHPSSLFALTGLALALTGALDVSAPALPLLAAGASFGLAVTIRPFTALLLGLPLLLVLGPEILRRHRPLPALAAFAAGGLPFAAFFALVNQGVTGHWWMLATTYLDPTEGLGFGVHGHTLQQGLQTTLLWFMEGLAYTFFLSPLLLLAARGHAGPRGRLLWMLLLAPVVGYVFYWNPGGNRYGPRFYFEALLPFTLLTGAGLARVLETGRYRALLAGAAAMGLAVLGKQCLSAHQQIEGRLAVYRAVEAAGIDHAVVLLLSGSADMTWWDLTRNPPRFREAPVLYARGQGAEDRAVAAAFPDRKLYYYRWDPAGGKVWPVDLEHPEPPEALPDL